MVRSARRTRHPSCELARGQCQDRRPAGSRAAGSVRMIGAPPGPPGDRRALRRRSSAYPEVALEGPFAEVLANAYSEYVRAAAAWQAGPKAHRQAAQAWAWSCEWHTSDAGLGRYWAPMSGSARPEPASWLPSPTRHHRRSLVAGAGRLPRRARSSEGRTASRGQTKAAPERAGEGGNSRAGAPGDAQRRWGTPGRPPPRGF